MTQPDSLGQLVAEHAARTVTAGDQEAEAAAAMEYISAIARCRDLSTKAKLVAVMHAADETTVSTRVADLEGATAMSRSSASRAKRELMAKGWMIKSHSGEGLDLAIPGSDMSRPRAE